eukprot:gene1105-2652_t
MSEHGCSVPLPASVPSRPNPHQLYPMAAAPATRPAGNLNAYLGFFSAIGGSSPPGRAPCALCRKPTDLLRALPSTSRGPSSCPPHSFECTDSVSASGAQAPRQSPGTALAPIPSDLPDTGLWDSPESLAKLSANNSASRAGEYLRRNQSGCLVWTHRAMLSLGPAPQVETGTPTGIPATLLHTDTNISEGLKYKSFEVGIFSSTPNPLAKKQDPVPAAPAATVPGPDATAVQGAPAAGQPPPQSVGGG